MKNYTIGKPSIINIFNKLTGETVLKMDGEDFTLNRDVEELEYYRKGNLVKRETISEVTTVTIK